MTSKITFALLTILGVVGSAPVSQGQYATPRDEKIAMHKKLARAHKDAAKCLESGATIQTCDQKLRAECPSGMLEQCTGLSRAELERHRQTHEMAGSKAIGK